MSKKETDFLIVSFLWDEMGISYPLVWLFEKKMRNLPS
mgnify:CR=1 FL=1